MTEASPARKLAQILFAIFFCLLCSGLIFGFAALKPILVQEGVYSELCRVGERKRDEEGKWRVCENQDLRLDLLFTLASVATSVAGFPTGFTLDALGPRKTTLIGACLMIFGSTLFGSGYQSSWFDAYLWGYFFIALGGPLICLSSFHLSNAFGGAHAGLILSAVTGSFDASSIPFVIYQIVYRKTEGFPNVKTFFWSYLIIPLLLVVEQLLIAPEHTYQRRSGNEVADETPTERDSLLPPSEDDGAGSSAALAAAGASGFSGFSHAIETIDEEVMAKKLAKKDTLTGTLYNIPAHEQMKTKWFWLLTAFVCVHMTRVNFFILSVDSQLEHFTGSRLRAEALTRLFSVMLPLGGILGIPAVGFLIDTRPFRDVMITALVFGIAFGMLGMTSSEWSQILGMGFFVVFRPLLYTSVSECVAKIMGFASFGTIYGAAMTISGIFALINAPLDVLVKGTLEGDYVPLNFVFILLGFLTSGALVFAIWRQTRATV